MWSDTKFSPSPDADGSLLGQLRASTCGSAGLDTCTAATVVLDSCRVHKVPLDAFGPVDGGMSAFPMGRAENPSQGNGGFGSTGPPQVHCTAVLTKDCPEKVCTLSIPGVTPPEIRLRRLLNTGVDITILSLATWPLECPLDPVQTSVAGLAGTVQCYISQRTLMIMNPNGHGLASCHNQNSCQSLRKGCASGQIFDVMKGAECPIPPIWWLVDKPVWENQWPLSQDKLVALHDLVQDQLDQGHLEPSTSPWKIPVFCIKKKSGKWRPQESQCYDGKHDDVAGWLRKRCISLEQRFGCRIQPPKQCEGPYDLIASGHSKRVRCCPEF
ncbi:hypothetical protein DUI87_05065 [Hirundo rustica rustica]|uniref:Peptidase A2 domain-containing protein n=1 Tax=Hirundo rustica rustica TaxID=333673 RepID=A0A3M0L316_HIRRU|nr:hypothetical protein DUI87_05065 [Hirundo rustica rustica]